MGLIEKFLMKVDNAYSKKEFDEKAYLINFILNEAHTVIRPINNKFWCYYLNLSIKISKYSCDI